MKDLIRIGLIIMLIYPNLGMACSMYKLTKNGKTIVGNNEDFFSPNGQFWFETGAKDTYGVMYMGFLDNFAQGAINEAGLMFDGFLEPYLEVKNTNGKLDIPIQAALKKIMQTMKSVEEVQSYLNTINLKILEKGQLVFVDKSGTYLIVEGDKMFIGDEEEKTFSNFYYSQTESLKDVELDYYQKGLNFINSTKTKHNFEYCSMAMQSFAQSKIAATQYSTIYDLKKLKIRVYLFNDFSSFIEIDLTKELRKGNHQTMIAHLFPKNSEGYIHYKKYNNPENPTQFLSEIFGDAEISEQVFLDSGIDAVINIIGYEWLNDIKNVKGAIKVFEYGVSLMPNNSNLYDSLGEAHYTNKDWNNAIKNYAKSLVLNPVNENAIAMIVKINKMRKEN
ncbi:Ntn hydrolase family protein [Winogradskyella jejuensis]|uniref:Uncharacterized protein n=1 Tax=Winogradskyella jejuensis TaxID=1089305 RepID=A0A1M5T301_9FLAO|nr:hypothetical protein [Winogradskyella jejuensis]SHH44733.1 hypothetical protein SAMN05444148_2037 [Winogradskyella jejuensis]